MGCRANRDHPRVRGKSLVPVPGALAERITPACAGKRSSPTWRFMPMGDHPRACGEKDGLSLGAEMMQGSPPRVRGKIYTTSARGGCWGSPPRVRGKASPSCKFMMQPGITPARAGKRVSAFPAVGVVGITPARAGKSWQPLLHWNPPQDHPRVRGEKRGADVHRKGWVDHPRACGEKAVVNPKCQSATGSPPRARGKDRSHLSRSTSERITPACAGKSQATSPAAARLPDHPRVRGEKSLYCGVCHGVRGSPPRARGKESLLRRMPRRPGITPACAGKDANHVL